MNDEHLEELLRATFEHDAARVRLSRPEWDPAPTLHPVQASPSRRARPVMAVACLLLVVVAAVAVNAAGSDRDLVVGSSPSGGGLDHPASTSAPLGATTTTAPPITLAQPADAQSTPITVPGAPTAYYRFAPDLDLAWTDRDGQAELCWRTPIDRRCVPHPVLSPDQVTTVVVPSSAQHTVILVYPAVGHPVDDPVTTVTVTRTDGEVHAVAVTWPDPQLHIGIARAPVAADDIRRAAA